MKIAIASGKGGTGKTFVSTNLFYVAQQKEIPVTLIDCDSEEPNVGEFIQGKESTVLTVKRKVPVIDKGKCTYCGLCQEYCTYNAILLIKSVSHIQVLEELCHDCGACLYACKYNAITEKEKELGTICEVEINSHAKYIETRLRIGEHSSVPLIHKAIESTDETNTLLLDSPPGISCPFIATVQHADYVILVTEPTPFGVHDLALSVDTLRAMNIPFGVVVNRAGLGNNEVYEYLEANKIPLLMKIPFDRQIAALYSDGKLVAESMPDYFEKFFSLYQSVLETAKS